MGIIDNNLSLRNRNKMLIGVWEDEDKLVETATALKEAGIKVQDIYTPYPVHGLDRIIGVKRSNLSVIAFICGATGFSLAFLMIWYMYLHDWPMDIGNKPVKFTPSWVPILFESTVLCTAFGMAFFFFWRNRMVHGIKPELLDERQTDDRLIVAIETSSASEEQKVKEIFNKYSPVEIRERMDGIQTVMGSNTSTPAKQEVKIETPAAVETPAETVVEVKELSEEERNNKLNVLKSVLGEASADHKDDLKDIVGVGPKYETDLHSLGIYTFEQISKLNDDAIEAIESLTKYFPGKIQRDDWKGQALEFLKNKGGNQ